MITISWYNIVAIVAAVLFVIWIFGSFRRERQRGGMLSGLEVLFSIACAIIFFLVFGGIFWW